MNRCSSCNNMINDPYYLLADDRCFHLDCLRCSVCQTVLSNDAKMFMKSGRILCKTDYLRATSGCSGCGQLIARNSYALKIPCNSMMAGTGPTWLHYHPSCLHCSQCRRSMSTGDRYLLRQDNLGIICLMADCASICRVAPPSNLMHSTANVSSVPTTTTSGRKRGRQSNAGKVKAEKLNQYQ